MADLIVVVPSRGRPESVRELAEAFDATCTADTEIVVVIDGDDPSRDAYAEFQQKPRPPRVRCVLTQATGNMVTALNVGAHYAAQSAVAVGFMGDDHRPRTHGWDSAYVEALWDLGPGIVYGDDMLQGKKLPTQCAMTADIVRALGYMSPPSLTHMYVDNFWLSLGQFADCIRYLPDVVVEHRHPVAGKAQWDDGYLRVNDPGMFAKDEAAFAEYCRTTLVSDVEKVQALRTAHV
jgi:glycosyltransferase involved in cell wall biosynthesis